MKRFLVLGSVLAGSIAFLPNTTNAQMRGGTVIAPRMAAPAVVPHAVAPRPVAPRPAAHPVAGARLAAGAPAVAKSGAGTLRVRTVNGVTHIIVRRAAANLPRVASPVSPAGRLIHGSSGDMDQDDLPNFRTVPGLGFDFPHLAAVFGPDAVGAGKHERFSGIGSFVPLFDGGFFLPQQPVVVEEEPGGDQAEPVQANAEAKAEATAEARLEARRRATAEQSRVSQPVPETPPYVLVKQDGTLVFVVAYSWESGKVLRYMTSQGLWGTLAREALDLDATEQFNQQRGLSFQPPARG